MFAWKDRDLLFVGLGRVGDVRCIINTEENLRRSFLIVLPVPDTGLGERQQRSSLA